MEQNETEHGDVESTRNIRTFQKEIRGSFNGAETQTAPCARSDRQPRHRISRRADRRVGR